MQVIKFILKCVVAIFILPIVYLSASLLLILVPVNKNQSNKDLSESIYLQTNGVHLTIILSADQLHPDLLHGLQYNNEDDYFAFGWGDKNFYLTTHTWNDLTFKNAFIALFIKTDALVHVIRYRYSQEDWLEIKVNQNQLNKINGYIKNTFRFDANNKKIHLKNKGYSNNDDFYEALGKFTCFKTCNTWVNSCLRCSDIKSLWWTPFDFGLLRIYKR